MNKLIKTLSTLGLALAVTTPVFATPLSLNINNKNVTAEQAPVMQDGAILVPLKVISEHLGAIIEWNQKERQVIVKKDTDKIVLTLGSKQAIVNGQIKTLAQPPKTIKGTTMLPVRFVAENLNCEVQYDKGSQTVYVTSDGIVVEIPNTAGWKQTTIKNPKVINDNVYLTEEQVTKCFDVIFDKYSNAHKIIKDDTELMFYLKDRPQGPRVNRRYVPFDKPVVKMEGAFAFYYPLEFITDHFNGSYTYDEKSKQLTVMNKGKNASEQLVATQDNIIKGYIKWPDDTPAVGVKVPLSPFYLKEDGQFVSARLKTPREEFPNKDDAQVLYAITDENGYYEFESINTNEVPYININIIFDKNGKSYTTSLGSEIGSLENPNMGGESHISSKRLEYPVMYIHENWAN